VLALQETYAHLLVESPSAHVVSVTLNRPEVLNALNTQMGRDLILCFRRISQDGEARAVVLAAAGTRAFWAGA
jgi:enoyl-CoA hydratase/carnithine racemase